MSDCTCHAGKICEICEHEVMGNLNKYATGTGIEYPDGHVGGITERLKGRTNYHNSEEGLMSPNSIDDFTQAVGGLQGGIGGIVGGIVGGHLGSPTPEQEGPDLVGETIKLSERIDTLETAKAFHMACIENLVERLNDAEGKLRSLENAISSIELSRLRGNG